MQSLAVCVTGGTGFFGHNLIKLLQQDPRVGRIHVLARHDPPSETEILYGRGQGEFWYPGIEKDMDAPPLALNDLQSRVVQGMKNPVFADTDKITVFRGNVCDPNILDQAMAGCQVVFHVCGDTRWWNAVRHEQYNTNVNGTVHVLQCAKRSPTVQRVIVTGTVDSMGHGDGEEELDERHDLDTYSFKGFGYWYADTKRQAEEYIRTWLAGERDQALLDPDYKPKECVVIRASSMVGPWDVTLQYGRIFVQIRQESVDVIPPGGLSVCHVDDVARLHIRLAFEREHPLPLVIIAAGTFVTYRQLYYDIRDEMRKQLKDWKPRYLTIGMRCMEIIPRWPLIAYGYAAELWSNVWSGLHPEVNPGMARYLCCNTRYSSWVAQEYWDYPRDLEQRYRDALRDCCLWLAQRGKI